GEFIAHNGVVNCVRIGRKSGQIIATGGDDKMVNIWHIANPDVIMVIFLFKQIKYFKKLHGHQSAVECVTLDPEEQLVVAGSERGSLKLWDLEQQRVVRTFSTGHRSKVTCVDFHPYGDFFASGSLDTNVKVWDIRRK